MPQRNVKGRVGEGIRYGNRQDGMSAGPSDRPRRSVQSKTTVPKQRKFGWYWEFDISPNKLPNRGQR